MCYTGAVLSAETGGMGAVLCCGTLHVHLNLRASILPLSLSICLALPVPPSLCLTLPAPSLASLSSHSLTRPLFVRRYTHRRVHVNMSDIHIHTSHVLRRPPPLLKQRDAHVLDTLWHVGHVSERPWAFCYDRLAIFRTELVLWGSQLCTLECRCDSTNGYDQKFQSFNITKVASGARFKQ